MKVTYNDSFNADELYDLFNSSDCIDGITREKLFEAMQKSSRLITVRLDEQLIGLVRSMDDGVLSANIDCLVVHGEHKKHGIEEMLITEMLKTLANVKYITMTVDSPELIKICTSHGICKPIIGRTLQRVQK